ncbi:hypothetical protein BD309DRAFT_976012, partial [Dichomitus squalens]
MLRSCPSLGIVNIRGWLEGGVDTSAVASDAVALPKLEKLYMELEPRLVPGVLLASLALPSNADVAVLPAVLEEGLFPTLLGAITPSSAPPCFQSFRCLHRVKRQITEVGEHGEDEHITATFPACSHHIP